MSIISVKGSFRAGRSVRAYTRSSSGRGGFKGINKKFERHAKIAGTMTVSSPEYSRLQMKRYSAAKSLPRTSKQARRLTVRKQSHAKQMYNGR